jgi:MraZ protein
MDAKYRIVLPAKIREKLGDVVMVAAGLDNCVSLFSEEDWKNFVEKTIAALDFYEDPDDRDFARLMLNSAGETPLDGMGRILLPTLLREYAQLKQDVVIAGTGDHVEIWDKDRWAVNWQIGLKKLADRAAGIGKKKNPA